MEIQVGVAQLDVKRAAVDENASAVVAVLEERSAAADQLVVFPECSLTGYIFDSAAAARAAAIDADDTHIQALRTVCDDLNLYAQVGFLELAGDDLYNTAALIGPGVFVTYRKQHIPTLGADNFVTAGTGEPVVVETPIGRLGMLICYDLRFPEHARSLALRGADILTMSTNWPDEVTIPGDLLTRARAAENRVFLAVANRSDGEGGVHFRGHSQLVDPNGEVVAMAPDGASVVSGTFDLTKARDKRGLFDLRRPDAYSALTEVPSFRDV